MLTGMLWMAIGIAAVAWLPHLPAPALLACAAMMSALLAGFLRWGCRYNHWFCQHKRWRNTLQHFSLALVALMLGVVWGCGYGYYICSGLLPIELEQQSLLLHGRIDGLVEQRAALVRAESAQHGAATPQPVLHFQFAVEERTAVDSAAVDVANSDTHLARTLQLPRLLQLNWYDAERVPQAGERWQLRVKLKRPRGFANPGGFDYAAWLVANRIGATGYVERSSDNRALARAPWLSIDALRGRAQDYLQQRLQKFSHRDLLLGLLLGDGGAIAATEWETFRATGTVHLFVVSGLQIAFTGGIALWFARLWWRSAWCTSRRRNYVLGAVPAFLVALIYALLAGWGVPIQRALIMFAVLVWALIARRQIRAATGWIAALWLVLLCDPLAVRDIGFWFSFIAVAAILLIICGHRSAPNSPLLHSALQWWRVQWALFASSLPLLLVLSGQLTLLALPANIIAIPLSTFISLPLAFLALLGDGVAPRASEWVWHYADVSLDWLWRYLVWLQQHGGSFDGHHNWAIWHPPGIDVWICAFVAIAAALLLLPRGTPGKAFAVLLLVPLCAPPLAKIAAGDCKVTVIDVGQGLSVLVETAQHNLLYDTGPPFGPERTVADLTVMPLLQQHGISTLDTVVVSHNDSDHSGGWPAIAREFDVSRLLIGEKIAIGEDSANTEGGAAPSAEFCRAGMHWRWDAVDFEVLYPSVDTEQRVSGKNRFSANNRSCVLQISAGDTRILLPGDIERGAEYALLDNPALQPTTLLLAPHHGSRSSSTSALVERVHPKYVVFSTGYRNHFGHPSEEVAQRYRQSGAALFDTAFAGALTFTFEHGRVAQISTQRSQQRHYWD